MTKEQEVRVGIRKTKFDEMVTDYGKDIQALRGNENLSVDTVTVEEDIVVIKATLSEGTVQ